MVIRRGDIWWAELPRPIGSESGHRRPILVLQNDGLNASELNTVVAIPLTSVMTHREAAGNVLLLPDQTGLKKPSLAVTTLLDTVEKCDLSEWVERLDDEAMWDVEAAVLRTLDIDR